MSFPISKLCLLLALAASAPLTAQEVPPPRPGGEGSSTYSEQQRADGLLSMGKHGSARLIYESLVEKAPTAVLHYKVGLCHKLGSDRLAALKSARRAIELQPNLLPALVLAIELVDDTEEVSPLAGLIAGHAQVDAAAYERVITALQRVGEIEAAFPVAVQAMVAFPDSAPLHYTAAEMALSVKRLPFAEECYAAIAKSNPRDPRALESLGRVQRFQGKKTAARATYERTLKVNPSNLAVRRELIELMEDAEADPEAIALQRRYLDYYERVHAAQAANAQGQTEKKQ